MRKLQPVIQIMCSIVLITACTIKEAPSQMGESISVEQLKNLPKDDSWNNKLVSFEGYFGFCRMANIIKAGSKAEVRITTEENCQGDRLIDAKILVELSGSTILAGAAPRNQLIIDKNINLETIKVLTDDYEKVSYQKFIFSGNLIYNKENYYLENVTIHLIK